MENIVRTHTSEDREQLIERIIGLQEHEREIDKNKKPGAEAAEDYLDFLERECNTKDGLIFVAEKDGTIIGFLCGWIEEESDETSYKNKLIYLSDLYVHPEFRREGVAQKLVHEVGKYALSKGIKIMRTCTLADNKGIQKFLESEGFKPHEITWESRL